MHLIANQKISNRVFQNRPRIDESYYKMGIFRRSGHGSWCKGALWGGGLGHVVAGKRDADAHRDGSQDRQKHQKEKKQNENPNL